MSILSRLCRYVSTYGYSTTPCEPAASLLQRPRPHSHRQRYARACMEEMEPRLLLTTLTNVGPIDSAFSFFGADKKNFIVTLHGDIAVELYGATPLGLTDLIPSSTPPPAAGVDIFSIYITFSNINSYIAINGVNVYTGGASSLYSLVTGGGFPITAPGGAGQVLIGEYDSQTSHIPIITTPNTGLVAPSAAAQTLAAATNGFSNITVNGLSTGTYYSGVYSANSIGKILIDGTVTGNVAIEGSIGTFYAGWLLTGDAAGNGNQLADNFDVTGDLGNLYVNTDIGSNVTNVAATGVFFDAGTQIHVGGKIGSISVGGGLVGTVTANDAITNISLANQDYQWTEPTLFVAPYNAGSRDGAFQTGLIPITGGSPFDNSSFAGATYVGTLDLTNGLPSINLSGIVQGLEGNPVDYYAFGLLAGQTVTVSSVVGVPTMQLGIFDPDGRLIFSTSGNPSGVASHTFTADRPGGYRVAIGAPGDRGLTGAGLAEAAYSVNITGVSNMGIGAIQTGGDIDIEDQAPSNATGITATSGDIGAIAAGRNLLVNALPGATIINVDSGNLLDVEAASIGRNNGGISEYPTITVHGEIGLITSSSLLYASVFATADIQIVNAAADLEGTYISDASIGIIRAGSILASAGPAFATIEANADNIGNDGTIDLIDVAGDLGSLASGGPRIETGIGGNLRFLHVGGSIYQDLAFGGGGTSTIGSANGNGGIIYPAGQSVALTDDSGSQITITPQPAVTTTTGNVTVTTPAGQITAYTYGIYGSGGVAIAKVISTGNITITSSSTNNSGSQSAEIGQIFENGAGAPLTTVNVGGNTTTVANVTTTTGGVVLPANDALAVATTLNAITIAGTVLTDIFDITGTGVINSIVNRTGGDIVNLNVGDVGNIFVNGNLGSSRNTTGADLNQIAVVSNAYPFQQQHTGIVAGNIVSITATGSIGNIIASGSIGTITPDSGGGAVKNTLVGLTGPIVVGGNLGTVNIGNGIGFGGETGYSTTESYGAGFSRTGIYATGAIVNIVGNNADIRSQIISTGAVSANNTTGIGIENIILTNGSLIGAEVGVVATIATANYLAGGNVVPQGPSGNINAPFYEVQNVTINGNGGIIGTFFIASDLGSFTVASTGFGILNSGFITVADGVVKSISAGGYGLRGIAFNGYKIINLAATGNGSIASPTQFSNRVRGSESTTIDPYTGIPVTSDTDLDLFLALPGSGDLDYRQGIIGESTFNGQVLGSVSAFSIVGIGAGNTVATSTGDTFDFARSIDSIKVAGGILDVRIIAGSIGTLTIGGDATGLDLEVAGAIGSIYIGGNFDSTSKILAKGPSSSIKSLTVVGNFAGTLTSQGFVNTLIIGGTGKKGSIAVGTFNGTIQLLGGSSAKNLIFAAGFNGDFEVGGNVGSISFLQGLSSTAALTVHGSLGSLTIGGDKTKNLGLAGHVTIQGTLGQLLGGGAFTGSIITTGNLGKVKYAGSFGGSTTINGSIGSFTLIGDVIGAIIANGAIGPVKLTGNVTSTGSFTSNAGSITNFTINKGGTLDGHLSAPIIGKLLLPAMGNNAKISAGAISSVQVTGNVTGALIQSNTAISSLLIGGSLSNSVVTAGSAISTLAVRGLVTSSVIQSGITAGADGVYGTADANETVAFGGIGKMAVGGLTNSVVAAGGSIGSFISGGLVDSSVSSGLVLNAAALQAVVAGTNPLATVANVDTLRINPTLLFGNIGSINIANGAEGGLDANSAISAGISPGADGIFQSSDISNPPAVPGVSTILKIKLAADEFGQVFQHNPA